MIGCLRTRVRKQPIIMLYFESENELKFYNLEARSYKIVRNMGRSATKRLALSPRHRHNLKCTGPRLSKNIQKNYCLISVKYHEIYFEISRQFELSVFQLPKVTTRSLYH